MCDLYTLFAVFDFHVHKLCERKVAEEEEGIVAGAEL